MEKIRGDGGYFMQVYLRCEKMLRMDCLYDFGDPSELLHYFKNNGKGIIPDNILNEITEIVLRMSSIDHDKKGGVDKYNELKLEIQKMFKTHFKELGYDSIVYKNETEGNSDSYIIFEPNQVKSIYNKGKFSLKDDNIYK